MRTARVLAFSSAVLLLATAPSTRAQDKDPILPLLKTAEDTTASLADREKALFDARGTVDANRTGNQGPFLVKSVLKILKELEKKKTDPTYQKLISAALYAADPAAPAPELGPGLKPFLSKDTPNGIRVAAIDAVGKHGPVGFSAEFLSLFEEATEPGDKAREQLELKAVSAVHAMQGQDAEKVLDTAIKTSKYHNTRVAACHAMGEIPEHHPPHELEEGIAKGALTPQALATNIDVDVACAAALALTHWGTYDGIGEVLKRMQADKRGGSKLCYRTVCEAARKIPQGFASLSPDRYVQAAQNERTAALAEMTAWWEKIKGSKPTDSIFEDLKAAGVTVPKDTAPANRETIVALIAGLGVESRALRYACLDLLVRRTGKVDLARDWRRLSAAGGGSVGFVEEEPAQGFPEGSPKANRLYELQKKRAEKWKVWWDGAHATFTNGVWKG